MKLPIKLSYPDKRLSPNARMNRFALAKIKQDAREEGFFAAKQAGLKIKNQWLQIFIRIHPPDKRKRDDDNVVASLKAARDGIFDALGIDDNQVRVASHGFGRVVQGGMIFIWIEPLESVPEWLEV